MKPILFEANTTTFTKYGLGVLSDAISCTVTEERNGEYELEMEYPADGLHVEDITHSRIIYAIPSDGASKQAFRIYKISKPMDGVITVNAEHISYQLAHIPCGAFTANGISSALLGLKQNAYENCPFDFWTDKTTAGTYKQEVPASIRSRLGGSQGSVLDLYGGEYEWDNYTVKLYNNRGSNSGVSLRYGKNITDIKQEENISNTITGVVPYYKNNETIVTLPEHVIYSSNASLYPYKRTVVVDFSQEFENTPPTVAQLRAKAENYITANGVGIPKVSIKVSFVPLWQTEEYKDVAALERVRVCDTVNVFFEKLDIVAQAKVIKTTYDVLMERYESIELGEATSKMSTKTAALEMSAVEQLSSSDLDKAIAHATALITGGLGGYVIFNKNADGEPEEILIMDTPSTETAVNVIRMNKNGIGFSNTGYSGTYRTGWTIDGRFVADFITSGTLSSITIKGNTIDNGNGTFHVDTNGHLKASDAEITGEIKSGSRITAPIVSGGSISGTTFNNGNGTFRVESNGSLTANNASVRGTIVSQTSDRRQTATMESGALTFNRRLSHGDIEFDYNVLQIRSEGDTAGCAGSTAMIGYTTDFFQIIRQGLYPLPDQVLAVFNGGNYDPAGHEEEFILFTNSAYFNGTNRFVRIAPTQNDTSLHLHSNADTDTGYCLQVQDDGRLVMYDVSDNWKWLWYIDTDGSLVPNTSV